MDNAINVTYVANILEDYLKRIVAMIKQCFAWFGWAKEAVTNEADQIFDYVSVEPNA